MNTNRLSETLRKALNDQMTKEAAAPKFIFPMAHGQTLRATREFPIFFFVMRMKSEIT